LVAGVTHPTFGRYGGKVRDNAGIDGLVSHTLRKTVASFLDDA
jgi:hypothetical protein